MSPPPVPALRHGTRTPSTNQTSAPRRAPAETAPSPEAMREAATEQVHQQIMCSPPPRAARGIARFIQQAHQQVQSPGMTAGLVFHNEGVVRQLGRMSRSELRTLLERAGMSSSDAQLVTSEIVQGIQQRIQSGMRGELHEAVRTYVSQLRAERDNLLARLEAPEGTPEAQQAEELARSRGMTRSELVAQVREGFDTAIETFEAYDGHLDGLGWEAGDFPELAARTIQRTFGRLCPGSMASEALTQRSTDHDFVETGAFVTQTGIEALHAGLEVSEALHATTAAAVTGATLAVGGLAASLLIHHLASEYHEAFITNVHTLVERGPAR